MKNFSPLFGIFQKYKIYTYKKVIILLFSYVISEGKQTGGFINHLLTLLSCFRLNDKYIACVS